MAKSNFVYCNHIILLFPPPVPGDYGINSTWCRREPQELAHIHGVFVKVQPYASIRWSVIAVQFDSVFGSMFRWNPSKSGHIRHARSSRRNDFNDRSIAAAIALDVTATKHEIEAVEKREQFRVEGHRGHGETRRDGTGCS